MAPPRIDLIRYAYAHRGLWGEGVTENSLAAFRAAAASGLGVELDVRMTRDGELVVFHDRTLERLCGSPKQVADINFVELRGFRLPDGSRIPILREALEAMAGLPTLIELKIDPPHRRIVPIIIEFMNQSPAPATLMSFDEPSVWRMKTLMPERQIGQLIEPLADLGPHGVAQKAARARNLHCAYIAPHHSSLAASRDAGPLVTWTIRTESELSIARKHGAAPIFEGLKPALAIPHGTPI